MRLASGSEAGTGLMWGIPFESINVECSGKPLDRNFKSRYQICYLYVKI